MPGIRGFLLALLLATACAPAPAVGPAPSPALRGDTVRERTLAPGVRHQYVWDPSGPWAVHVAEVNLQACGIELRAAKGGDRVQGRETVSVLAAATQQRLGRPVLAAVNADFFSFRPPGVPVGAHVQAGEIVRGPGRRPVFGVTADRTPFIGVVSVSGETRTSGDFAAPIGGVNTPPDSFHLSLYNGFSGPLTPVDTGAVEVVVRRIGPPGEIGDPVRGTIAALDTTAAGMPLSAETVVLSGRGAGAAFLRHLALPGDTLRWSLRLGPAPGPIREAVGGFPHLLRAGVPVSARDPELRPDFAETRHPRTAVGWRADGTLLLVTVDGRQPPYSAGMTLAELTDLMRRLGATDALNLDGGGSTAMLAGSRIVNRPSDKAGERPVANALLVLGPRPGECGTPRAPDRSPAGLEARVRETIRRFAGDSAEVAVAFRDLATGDSVLIDAHTPMHAASTMKVPVMLELFRLADEGELRLSDSVVVRNEFRSIADGSPYSLSPADDSDTELYGKIGERVAIRELTERMITRSSNLATNLLIDLADPARIARMLDYFGAGEVRVLRGVEDGPAYERGMNNTTTAYGLMKTLGAIARGDAASPAATGEMLRILEAQEFREMIPAGVPPGTRVANKTGWIPGINHDAAIVYPPGRAPYVLVVLTRGFTDRNRATEAARRISEQVYRAATDAR